MEPESDMRTAIVPVDDKKLPLPSSVPKSKKKRGSMSFLRAALFMWRRRGSSKKKSKAALQIEAATASAGMLNKVVGSMRPLHVQGGESPPQVAATAHAQPEPGPEPAKMILLAGASPSRSEHFEDVPLGSVSMMSPVASPSHCSSASPSHCSSVSEGTSRYSSALNLQELDKNDDNDDSDDDDDDDRKFEALGGDEMIDAKAEEFITQFYQQMKIQNYNEMVRRSARRSW
ncbi:hypothetical protein CRG98_005666 [Punica granatum]|uniref:Uncharacterized protein n=1 Tax=Punica granatum TaxID=22663 RepID=A0A2I0KZR6_PUNGR|nr:hypothetical protein CRG98_005666 [Punica granatum]